MRIKMHEQEMNELIARLDWLVKQQAHLILMENFSQNEKMYCKEFILRHSKHSIVVLYHFYEDIQIDHGVATQCGKCEDSARAIWSECCSQPVAHLQNETVQNDVSVNA